jgi:glycosyltransferase involved in cell wall biosynthesis
VIDVLIDAAKLRDMNSGLGQFTRSLGLELMRIRPVDVRLGFVVPKDRIGAFGDDARYVTDTWTRRVRLTDRMDVWHAIHQDSPFRPRRGTRTLQTILDLNFLERADYSARKRQRRLDAVQRRIDRAASITTISAYTAEVVRRHLDVGATPIHVVHLGNPLRAVGGSPRRPRALAAWPAGDERFLLFVGVVHPKKNVRLIVAMLRELPSYRLVIAGRDDHPYAAQVRDDIRAAGLENRAAVIGTVDDDEKRWLLDHAAGLVFPSLSEGFGLPVVEAMDAGIPVFLSRLTSLPEIGGDEAFYFPSFDPQEMAHTVVDGLRAFSADPTLRDRLRQRAATFSWDRAARRYLTLYSELARTPS